MHLSFDEATGTGKCIILAKRLKALNNMWFPEREALKASDPRMVCEQG